LLQKENIRLTTELQKSKESMSLLESALAAARGALHAANNGASLSEVRAIFSAAKANLGVEYVAFEMHILALAVALPLLKQWLQTWSPLADPTGALSEFSDWKPLLLERENIKPIMNSDQDVNVDELFASSDPYERLVLELVLPPLRKELVQTWDPKDTTTLEEFVESWEPILPSSVILYIMQHLVLPKLQSAVQAWDPLHDPIAPHTWLHPWLVRFSAIVVNNVPKTCVL
jgi:tuftelin-interacting protein 11